MGGKLWPGLGPKRNYFDSIFFLTQLMSIPEIYLPNPVEIYNFFTQPNEKYCITKIILEKSRHSSDENTDVIGGILQG